MALAILLVVTGAVVAVNVWTGVVASISYLSYAVWLFVERLRNVSRTPPVGEGL